MQWRVWAESTEIDDEDVWSTRVDRLLDQLGSDPQALGPVGHGQVGQLGSVFAVEAPDLASAADRGIKIFSRAVHAAAGEIGVTPMRIEVEPEGYEPLQLVGATDAGKILGVKRQRVYQLMETYEDFPTPVATPARGALWDRRAVVAWNERSRPPGRRRDYRVSLRVPLDPRYPLVRGEWPARRRALVASLSNLKRRVLNGQGVTVVDPEIRWSEQDDRTFVITMVQSATGPAQAFEAVKELVDRRVRLDAGLAIDGRVGAQPVGTVAVYRPPPAEQLSRPLRARRGRPRT